MIIDIAQKYQNPCVPVILIFMHVFNKIESAANKRIKDLVRLRDGNGPEGQLFIEGMNIVEEAVRSKFTVRDILITDIFLEKHETEIEKLRFPAAAINIISEAVAKKLSGTRSTQGIYAVVEYLLRDIESLRLEGPSVIPVLDRIQDPGNLGTIIRTADAFGYRKLILLQGTCLPLNQKTVRSSAGSLFHMEIVLTTENELVQWSRTNSLPLVVMDPRGGKVLQEVLSERCLLTFGNEAGGASDFLKEHADERVRIDIPGRAESLNVSIAAAITFYEATRMI